MKKIEALNFRMTCMACPTQYEFEDALGNQYYFRLRWGGWTLYDITKEEWKLLASGGYGDCYEGCCDEEEFLKILKQSGYEIIIKTRVVEL